MTDAALEAKPRQVALHTATAPLCVGADAAMMSDVHAASLYRKSPAPHWNIAAPICDFAAMAQS